MDDIEHQRYHYKYDDQDDEIDSLSFVRYLKVDIHSKHVCLVGKHKIMVIDIVNQG